MEIQTQGWTDAGQNFPVGRYMLSAGNITMAEIVEILINFDHADKKFLLLRDFLTRTDLYEGNTINLYSIYENLNYLIAQNGFTILFKQH